jgi:hypothetical protein
LLVLALTAAALLLALLPWWRNHDYLRDFFDYGLVMSGVSRISDGERPYVDFVTPIQSGTFWLNALPERLGGGTYQAMTLGAAALIILSLVTLAWLLARRLPWWAAIVLAGAVVIGSASQHTIIWYNSVGVLCLAVAAWGGAIAPVLRRERWVEHTLVAAALFLGGVNKLNYHLVAVAAVAAWALRALLVGQANWRRVLATLLFVLVTGTVAPLLSELLWTGATLSQWSDNVITLAAAGRAEYFRALLTTEFYLKPQHAFYGPLALPQIGLTTVVLVTLAGVASVVGRRGAERLLAVSATVFALAAALALLATNNEIAYLGLAAASVLAIALWLGFVSGTRPAPLLGALVLPTLLCGGVAWESAWQGQRSQFGHSPAPRAQYRDPSLATPRLEYLRGTKLPPEICDSIEGLISTLPPPDAHGRRPVFYGPGFEWYEHICPSVKTPGLPLWLHDGTSYGPLERGRLAASLTVECRYQQVLVPIAWDQWPQSCRLALELGFTSALRGPWLRAYDNRPASAQFTNPLDLLNFLGGNLHPAYLSIDPHSLPSRASDGRMFLGRTHGSSAFRFNAPSNRLAGTVIVQRRPGAPAGTLSADFTIHYTVGDNPGTAWNQTVTLPAGANEATADYQIDSRQQALSFVSHIPIGSENALTVGWFGPRVMHAQAASTPPPSLYPDPLPNLLLSPEEVRTTVPATWQPDAVLLRGGVATADHFELPPGGELWLRANHPVAELLGRVRIADNQPTEMMPVVRLVWCKGGRIEILNQGGVRSSDRQLELRAWSAEPDGWMGVLIDPKPGTPPALVYIDSVRRAE